MGEHYQQLTIEERCEMARLHAQDLSIRQIATSLDRSPSTVSRELNRNGSRTQGYQPVYAQQQARARRWSGSRLERDSALRHQVLSCLQLGWSPEQVAGRLAQQAGHRVISHETIYRFIHDQIARKKDYSWRHFLPKGKSKRGWRGRKGGSSSSFIHLRQPLSHRPVEALDRSVPGHWEADLMLFGNRGHSLLAIYERHSRLLLAVPLFHKAATTVAASLTQLLAPFPPQWRRTISFDNGTEFAHHYQLHALGLQTFFCDTHSPWQKGGVENSIGRLRRFLPRKTSLDLLPAHRLFHILQAYNNTPRKCLGYNTPAEVFLNQLLHFKCESTFLPSQERRVFPSPPLNSEQLPGIAPPAQKAVIPGLGPLLDRAISWR